AQPVDGSGGFSGQISIELVNTFKADNRADSRSTAHKVCGMIGAASAIMKMDRGHCSWSTPDTSQWLCASPTQADTPPWHHNVCLARAIALTTPWWKISSAISKPKCITATTSTGTTPNESKNNSRACPRWNIETMLSRTKPSRTSLTSPTYGASQYPHQLGQLFYAPTVWLRSRLPKPSATSPTLTRKMTASSSLKRLS